MSALKLSADAIQAHLDEWGITEADVLLPDADYALPTREWVEGDFATALQPVLEVTVGVWDEQDSDCDDFAEEAAAFAHRCHRKTLDRPRETALAFGEFWYKTRNGGAHAINVFLYLELGEIKIGFFEPQTCSIVELTKTERASCMMVRM